MQVLDESVQRQSTVPGRPVWNAERRELRYKSQIVKRFRVAATVQERILAAIEEENWTERIDDPLPPVESIESKRRLNTAIKSLNRNRRAVTIRFFGDGTGQGICWEPEQR